MQEPQDQPKDETDDADPAARERVGRERDANDGLTREQRRAFARAASARDAAAKAAGEIDALKQVAQQINGTAQLAVKLLEQVITKELELQRIDANGAVCIVVRVEPGRELRDEVCDQLAKLLKVPMIVVPKDMRFEALPPELMERAGWTRKGPRGLVSASGEPISVDG